VGLYTNHFFCLRFGVYEFDRLIAPFINSINQKTLQSRFGKFALEFKADSKSREEDELLSAICNHGEVFRRLSCMIIKEVGKYSDLCRYQGEIISQTGLQCIARVRKDYERWQSVKWTRIYQASEHGFRAASFWDECVGLGSTVTIAKNTNGQIAAGFNGNIWNYPGVTAVENDTAPNPFVSRIATTGEFALVQQSATCTAVSGNVSGPSFEGSGMKCLEIANSNGGKEGIADQVYLFSKEKTGLVEYEVFAVQWENI
jgi:hypothetical protein